MVHVLASLIGALLWLTDPVLSGEVHQSPAELMRNSGESIQLNCSHSIPNYYAILWYHQAAGDSGLTLMGYVYSEDPTIEPLYKDHCSMSGDGRVAASLHIPKVRPADSGKYFCAASFSGVQAYFGNGTKLTVLDPNIPVTPPEVKLLPPSNAEICNQRKERKKDPKVTLVCVVTRFYPDHIIVSWQLNGREIIRGNKTDDAARRDSDNKYYSITSRLRVQFKKWFNNRNSFTCITKFYNGSYYLKDQDTINGVSGDGLDRDYLLKVSQTAKLSYSLFIAKSFLYGLFISIVVWKIRTSAAKNFE